MKTIEIADCGLRIADYHNNPQSEIRNPKSQRSFTLVEVMVTMAVFAVLGIGFVTALVTGQSSFFTTDAGIQVQQEARRALDVMVRELREAGPPPPTEPMVTSVNGPLNSNQLNFQIARSYNGATIDWGAALNEGAIGDWIHYVVMANPALVAPNDLQLVRCVTAAGAGSRLTAIASGAGCRVLANNIERVNFTGPTSGIVTIVIQAQYRNNAVAGGVRTTGLLTSRVWVRN